MAASTILAPVFVQVLLTFVLMVIMGRRRMLAINTGGVRMRDVALSGAAFPDAARQAANSYANQFEQPVLFYVVVAFALLTGQVSGLLVGLAWAFVAARLVHAGVHITSNRIRHRFMAFVAGAAILMAMWAVLAWRVFTAGGI